jgi:hypothetical protein
LLDGAIEDEEEQAILAVLRTSKERSTADFAQIAARAVAAPRIALTRA